MTLIIENVINNFKTYGVLILKIRFLKHDIDEAFQQKCICFPSKALSKTTASCHIDLSTCTARIACNKRTDEENENQLPKTHNKINISKKNYKSSNNSNIILWRCSIML